MEIEGMIIICILSCSVMLGMGIAQIRDDISEIKSLLKNK
jgi:hypothetical protein